MKRFIPYILIIAIVSGFLLSVVPPPREAEGLVPLIIVGSLALWQLIGHSIGIPTPIDLTLDFAKMSLSYILAGISWFFFQIANVVVSISGYLLDVSIEKSITFNEFIKGITTPDGKGAIDVGWSVSRDVVNLFFIFILLYIAIATILQISGYGIKDLLVKVIIIALLVNFSLMITKVIIDASNILALEFYENTKVKIKAPADDPGGKFKKGDEIQVNSPALVFSEALKFQTIFKTEGRGISGFIEKADKFDVALVLFLGTIVLLVVAFVFCAMAVLFIIRTVALIFLMVISPLAFLAMALPATKAYASQWWIKLFKQAFFAPFCLFLLYLSAMIVSSPGFVNITDSDDASFALALSGQSSHFGIIFSYILVIGLLIGSLLVAKEMGAYGAGAVMKWGKQLKGAGQGYAGRIAKAPARFAARQTVARAGEALAGEGKAGKWMQRFVTRMPRIGGWASDRAKQMAEVAGRKETIDRMVERGMRLPGAQRADYLERLGKGLFQDKQAQKEMFKRMSARERVELVEKKPEFEETYKRLVGTKEKEGVISAEEREKTEKTRKEVERKGLVSNLSKKETPIEEFKSNIKLVKPEEIKELDEAIFKIRADEMINNFGDAQIKKVFERGDGATDAFFSRLALLGDTAGDVANRLEKLGNRAGAAWARTPGAKTTLESYGMGVIDKSTAEGRQREIDKATRRGEV